MIAIALVLSFLAAAPAFAGPDAPLRVTVQGETLFLAQVVPGVSDRWADVSLGPAPRPGRRRTLSASWIRRRAEQAGAPIGAVPVPERVVVERPGSRISRSQVVDAVQVAVASRLGPDEQLRIRSVGLPPMVPDGDLALRVRLPDGPLPSPATLWVDVAVDGVRQGRAWARVEVFRSRPVLVVVRDVGRGEVLGPEDVEVRAGDGRAGALVDPQQAVGRRARRTLRAGSPVRARDLEVVSVIDRGGLVRLVARVGGITATTVGRALGDAGIGETVRVENLASGRTVSGIVQADGVVAVSGGRRSR